MDDPMTAAVEQDLRLAELGWLTDRMLSHQDLIPASLAVLLRTYKTQLRQPDGEPWAVFGPPSRYAQIAQQLRQRISDGEWPPGTRLPAAHEFTRTYGASERTVARAIHVLALQGILTYERGAYYITARM
jgi:Bacterial regulatory proteins, gntR family